MKFKAFISYKHSESSRAYAVAIERAIKRYAKPIFKFPRRVFRDEQHMAPGNDLGQMIREGLSNSEFLIFLACKDSADSVWCQQEIEYWCNELNRKDKLIIVHLDDRIEVDAHQNQIDWNKTTALPHFLKQFLQGIPFYVDFTWIQKGQEMTLQYPMFKSKINQVVARLDGKTPEEMFDEDLKIHQKNKRIRIIFNLSLVLITLLLIVSFFLTQQDYQKSMELSSANFELDEKEALKGELEYHYHGCVEELEALRESNEELKELVEQLMNNQRKNN